MGSYHRPFEGGVASQDAYLAIADLHAIDEQVDIFAPDLAVGTAQLAFQQFTKLGQHVRRDLSSASVELTFEHCDIRLGADALGADVGEFGGDLRIVRAAQLVANELDDPSTLSIQLGQAAAQALEAGLTLRDRGRRAIDPGLEQRIQPLGPGKVIGERIDYNRVELLHRHAAAGTGIRPLPGAGGAGIIFVLAGLAGAGRHTAPAAIAATAAGDAAGQEVGVGFERCVAHSRISIGHLLTDGVEQFLFNHRRYRDRHPFIFRAGFAGARVAAIEQDVTDIGGVGQNAVDVGDTEPLAAQTLTALVKELRQRGDADRATGGPVEIGVENPANEIDRLGIMLELLAVLALGLGHYDSPEAQWRGLSVPVSLYGVGDHRTADVLAIFGRVIFIEDGKHRDRHVAGRVVTKVLRYGDDPNLATTKAFAVLHEVQRVAETPRQRMDENHVDRMILPLGQRDHLSKGTPLVGGGTARLGEDPHLRRSILLDPTFRGCDLVRQ